MSISGTVSAEFAPSVWQQLQMRGVTVLESEIKSLEISDDLVVVEFSEGRAKLCGQDSYLTDQRVVTLREALKSGERLMLGFQGPWNTCLKTISQRRTNSKS